MNSLADCVCFVGLFNTKDQHHARCKAYFSSYDLGCIYRGLRRADAHHAESVFCPGRQSLCDASLVYWQPA